MDMTYALIQEYVSTGDADALRVLDDWMQDSGDDGKRVAEIVGDEMAILSASADSRRRAESMRRLAQAAAIIFIRARRPKLRLARAATWGFNGRGFAFKIDQVQDIDQLKDVRHWWRRGRGTHTEWSVIVNASIALRARRGDGPSASFSEFLISLGPAM